MILLNMNKPNNCKECFFRINRSRTSWRCALHKTYREAAVYISVLYTMLRIIDLIFVR